jgi:hypothetical protein
VHYFYYGENGMKARLSGRTFTVYHWKIFKFSDLKKAATGFRGFRERMKEFIRLLWREMENPTHCPAPL